MTTSSSDQRPNAYAVTLDELERGARVPLEQQSTAQAQESATDPVSAEELNLQRMLVYSA